MNLQYLLVIYHIILLKKNLDKILQVMDRLKMSELLEIQKHIKEKDLDIFIFHQLIA